MITSAEYKKWLELPNQQRVILAELTHSAGVEYIASRPFISKPVDAHPNRIYNDLLQGQLEVHERLDSKLDLGVLDLVDDGSITHWADFRWRGYPVILKLGSPAWSLDDFRVLARQINGGVISAQRGKIQLGIYDATAILQQEIQRPELPSGQLEPLLFGNVFCAPAVRIGTGELRYSVSHLPVTSLIVRDGNGPVIGHAPDYAKGEFVASAYSPRTLMCEVSEPHKTPLQIAQWVASYYGLNISAETALPNYTLGLRYDGAVTGAQILDDVCHAIGAHWQINSFGELKIQIFELPGASPQLVFEADDIQLGKITLQTTQEPLKQLTLNYARNFNPLTEVAGSLSASDADRLTTEWLAVSNQNLLADYPLAKDEKIETALQFRANAETELARRLAIKNQRRDVYRITVLLPGLTRIVGKAVQINHPRFNGRLGRIIGAKSSPLQDKTELEVWF